MMPNMMPRVGRGSASNVYFNTGHGHLGWTLSAVTADMVAQIIDEPVKAIRSVGGFELPFASSNEAYVPIQR
jgi:D-amino-acid dehydrogenase